jgi:hypothetical protein
VLTIANIKKLMRGTPGRIRTADFLFRRQTLYPAELRALNGTLHRTRTCNLQYRKLTLYPIELAGRICGTSVSSYQI